MRDWNLRSSVTADVPPSAGAIDVPPVQSYGKNPAQSQRKGNGAISSKGPYQLPSFVLTIDPVRDA